LVCRNKKAPLRRVFTHLLAEGGILIIMQKLVVPILLRVDEVVLPVFLPSRHKSLWKTINSTRCNNNQRVT